MLRRPMSPSAPAIACLLLVAASLRHASLIISANGTESSQTQNSPSIRKRDLQRVEAGCNKGTLNKLALDLPLIAYPREAVRKNIGGKVTIKVFVDESGSVYYATPIDAHRCYEKSP